MKSFILICLFLSFTTNQVLAESLKKPYFAATVQGAWAKYESNTMMADGTPGKSINTYIRSPDNAGRVLLELHMEVVAGTNKGMTSHMLYIMEPDFDLAMNFKNYGRFIEANVAKTGDGEPVVTQDNMVKIMRESAGDFTNSVTFKGKVDMLGRKCDHYAYSFKTGGSYVMLIEGEIWLDETLPFGVVAQTGKTKDPNGKLMSSFEEKLLDSGTGESASAALLALTPKPKKVAPKEAAPPIAIQSLYFLKAYQSEKIRILVEVKKGSGGKYLILSMLNKTKEPFKIVVPKDSLTITAASPIGDLRLVFDKEHRLSLPPNGASPSFSAGQSGKRGVIDGKFKLTVYEGEPLLTGTVKIGSIK